MATAKKPAAKKAPAKKAPAKKAPAKPAAPAPPTYDELFAARTRMNLAHEAVLDAQRRLNSARTTNDFLVRDEAVRLATARLAEAEELSTIAKAEFANLKGKAK